jgi:hypothetical protein
MKIHYNSNGENLPRPFTPATGAADSERIAAALEYIAASMSRIEFHLSQIRFNPR